jgi:hypothetical protein
VKAATQKAGAKVYVVASSLSFLLGIPFDRVWQISVRECGVFCILEAEPHLKLILSNRSHHLLARYR